jgi:single-stranded-DNA-specific exonuclease
VAPVGWRIRSADPAAVRALSDALEISPLLARLLLQRGCATATESRLFLEAPLDALHDPWRMTGMAAAAGRLRAAVARGEAIRISGDYDVDGVCGTALLAEGLQGMGARVSTRIPHRLQDGYGLPVRFVDEAASDGIAVLVAVDAGISAHGAAERAKALGIDLIVCDHHQPPPTLPPALAILNPRQSGCAYPFKDLCGAGIAFKLLQAVRGSEAAEDMAAWLDLASLAAIADAVPLLGENRILVRHGLPKIRASARPGLQALAEVAGLDLAKTDLKPGHVAFVLAPRLNAAGRMGEASAAVRLLLTAASAEARTVASQLDALNRQRQAIEGEILDAAVARVEAARQAEAHAPAIILASAEWHPGVLGIVASRLVERYGVPAALIAVQAGEARGSVRSPTGWHVARGLARCADLLRHFGGHEAAGGFSLAPEKIDAFRGRMEMLLCEERPEPLEPVLTADLETDFAALDLALVDCLSRLAPHGMGNPEPLFVARQVQAMRSPRRVGRNHLKMRVRQTGKDDRVLDAIGFNLGDFVDTLNRPDAPRVDLAFTPERNTWNGREMLQLRVRSIFLQPNHEVGPSTHGKVQSHESSSIRFFP